MFAAHSGIMLKKDFKPKYALWVLVCILGIAKSNAQSCQFNNFTKHDCYYTCRYTVSTTADSTATVKASFYVLPQNCGVTMIGANPHKLTVGFWYDTSCSKVAMNGVTNPYPGFGAQGLPLPVMKQVSQTFSANIKTRVLNSPDSVFSFTFKKLLGNTTYYIRWFVMDSTYGLLNAQGDTTSTTYHFKTGCPQSIFKQFVLKNQPVQNITNNTARFVTNIGALCNVGFFSIGVHWSDNPNEDDTMKIVNPGGNFFHTWLGTSPYYSGQYPLYLADTVPLVKLSPCSRYYVTTLLYLSNPYSPYQNPPSFWIQDSTDGISYVIYKADTVSFVTPCQTLANNTIFAPFRYLCPQYKRYNYTYGQLIDGMQDSSADNIYGTQPTGGTGNYTITWQKKVLPNGNWINVSPLIVSSYNTVGDTAPAASQFSIKYRRIVVSGNQTNTSNEDTITYLSTPGKNENAKLPPIRNNHISASQIICANANQRYHVAPMHGSLPTGGNGSYSYLWQDSRDSGRTWDTTGLEVNSTMALSQNYDSSTFVFGQSGIMHHILRRRIVTSSYQQDTSSADTITFMPTNYSPVIRIAQTDAPNKGITLNASVSALLGYSFAWKDSLPPATRINAAAANAQMISSLWHTTDSLFQATNKLYMKIDSITFFIQRFSSFIPSSMGYWPPSVIGVPTMSPGKKDSLSSRDSLLRQELNTLTTIKKQLPQLLLNQIQLSNSIRQVILSVPDYKVDSLFQADSLFRQKLSKLTAIEKQLPQLLSYQPPLSNSVKQIHSVPMHKIDSLFNADSLTRHKIDSLYNVKTGIRVPIPDKTDSLHLVTIDSLITGDSTLLVKTDSTIKRRTYTLYTTDSTLLAKTDYSVIRRTNTLYSNDSTLLVKTDSSIYKRAMSLISVDKELLTQTDSLQNVYANNLVHPPKVKVATPPTPKSYLRSANTYYTIKNTSDSIYWVELSYGPGCPVFKSKQIYISTPDGDGNIYPAVKIGPQYWMMSNLRTTTFNDGSNIKGFTNQQNNLKASYTWYNNDSTTNAIKFGAFYNATAIQNDILGNSKNVCPVGWKPAGNFDWRLVATNAGGLFSNDTVTSIAQGDSSIALLNSLNLNVNPQSQGSWATWWAIAYSLGPFSSYPSGKPGMMKAFTVNANGNAVLIAPAKQNAIRCVK